jgi:hypothetical protein
MTIVEEVPKSGSPRRNHIGEPTARCRRNLLKFDPIQIAKKLGTFGPGRTPIPVIHRRIDMAIRDENVEQAVVVKIDEADTPRKKRNGRSA